jgi:hypothetical protein
MSTIEFDKNTNTNFMCNLCNKMYKDRTGLWKHKRKCKVSNNNLDADISDKDDLILFLLKQNNKLQKTLIGLTKKSIETNKTY